MASWANERRRFTENDTWRFIEYAQKLGAHRTTAYGLYRKHGGTMPASRFTMLWRLAKANPFNWNRAA